MSIDKRADGQYRVRWRESDGRQRARHFDRKRDAETFEATVRVDMNRGSYVDPDGGKLTVRAHAEAWALGQPWRDSTRTSRETILASQIIPAFGHVQLRALKTSDVQAWVGRMSVSLAASSVRTYFRVLAQMMIAARGDHLIHESPCVGVRLPRADRPAPSLTVLSGDQVAALADVVPRRYRALVLASAGLGLRQGEACALTVDRIDFLGRKVTIDRQVVTPVKGSICEFGPVKTESSNRVIPLPAVVGEALAAHIAEFGEGRDRLLFTTTGGAMLSRQTWHGAFSAAADRLKIDASSHDLRHHAASLLIAAGCSPKAVAAFLGHKNAAETLNTYAHLWADDEDRISAAIDAGLRRSEDQMRTRSLSDSG
ncbi:MAG TPA: tyrosine-type recombinase/integrase [Solirubrobacteraceae bacterium]|nr:tyrosine-type recombinase/integrase [Solirubrobacteraceae bacterium]